MPVSGTGTGIMLAGNPQVQLSTKVLTSVTSAPPGRNRHPMHDLALGWRLASPARMRSVPPTTLSNTVWRIVGTMLGVASQEGRPRIDRLGTDCLALRILTVAAGFPDRGGPPGPRGPGGSPSSLIYRSMHTVPLNAGSVPLLPVSTAT